MRFIPANTDTPEVPLTSHIGFEEGNSQEWISKPTTLQPIAGFRWRDLAPLPGIAVRYKIVAMKGPANKPQQVKEFVPLITSPVTATERYGKVSVYFNRGILSTQHLSRALKSEGETPSPKALQPHIEKAGDKIRLGLTGQLLEGLTSLIERAKREGGKCFASLYELTDDELIAQLKSLHNLEIILSNNTGSKEGASYDAENRKAADALASKHLVRRYMPVGQIGHNKFIVYVGPDNEPKAVLTGSTNWTSSGLCTQSNNCIVVESTELAKQYLSYWNDLKLDAEQANIPTTAQPMPDIQGSALRKSDAVERPVITIEIGTTAQVWFSPNANGLVDRDKSMPPDLAMLFQLCEKAEQAVMFLCFQPGAAGSDNATIVKFMSELSERRPGLFIRGVISDEAEAKEFMQFRDPDEDADIIAPAGILDGFSAWEKEFYKYGHAIVHDKIVVIDPFSNDKSIVVTGSHNLGLRASHNNDENMLILRGEKRISQAYATHVFDIYSHYRWRYYMMQKAQKLAFDAWQKSGGDKDKRKNFPPSKYFSKVVSWRHNEPNDQWQDRYFDVSSMASLERQFWVSDGAPLPARVPKTPIAKRKGSFKSGSVQKKAKKVAVKTSVAAKKKKPVKKSSKPAASKNKPVKKPAGKKAPGQKPKAKKAAKKPVKLANIRAKRKLQ